MFYTTSTFSSFNSGEKTVFQTVTTEYAHVMDGNGECNKQSIIKNTKAGLVISGKGEDLSRTVN